MPIPHLTAGSARQILDMEADDAPGDPVLRLRIPEPPAGGTPRNGCAATSNRRSRSASRGSTRRWNALALMRKGLIQVLGEDDKADGPWAPELSPEQMSPGSTT